MRNKKTPLYIIILTLITSFYITSCGLAPHKSKPQLTITKYKYVGSTDLYGLLVKTRDGYRFTKFSFEYDNNQPYVRINDLRPMFDTGIRRYCPANARNPRNECYTDSRMFRGRTRVYRSSYNNVFDINAYNSAIIDATQELALENKRELFINAVFGYHEKYTKLKDDYVIKLEKKYQKFNNINNRKFKEIHLVKSYIDKTGLIKHFKNNIKLDLEYKPKSHTNIPSYSLDRWNLIYADDLKRTFSNQTLKLKEIYEHNIDLISKSRLSDLISVKCKGMAVYNIELDVSCLKPVITSNNTILVKVSLNYVTLKTPLPEKLILNDKNLILEYNDGNINFHNKSKKYIRIEAVSVYFDGDISTKNKFGYELPPQSSSKNGVNISSIGNNSYQSIDFRIDGSKYSKKVFDFGFAVKYKTMNSSKEHTLYKVKKYSVSKRIKELL